MNWYLICAGILVGIPLLFALVAAWIADKRSILALAVITAFAFLLSWLLVKGTGH